MRIFLFLLCCGILTAKERFPPIAPNSSGMLQVDEIHTLYWEESGNPKGIPVIFLHGGPGIGTDESNRTFFDPQAYRIILFDQRGSGKSLPQGCLEHNTTWDLVEDINRLRAHLKVDRFVIFGGSWGSTLALTYAIKYPHNVMGMILRGIFLCEQQELDWYYKEGANQLSPEAWKIFLSPIPKFKHGNLVAAYHDHLHSDSWKKYRAAAAWVLWEFAHMHAVVDPRLTAMIESPLLFDTFEILYAEQNHTIASIENHYFYHRGFFESDTWIIDHVDRIRNIPGYIIQGRLDYLCPWENAYRLHQAWPLSQFTLLPNAGHASDEPGILDALLDATEHFKLL